MAYLLSTKLGFSFLAVPAKRCHLRHGALELSLSVLRLRLEGCPLVSVPDSVSLQASEIGAPRVGIVSRGGSGTPADFCFFIPSGGWFKLQVDSNAFLIRVAA